jgi:hydrogenase maturation factor
LDDPEIAFNKTLELGKVRNEVMRRSVFPFLPLIDAPSLDGGVIQLEGRTVLAHSPSIGLPLKALGFFAFHYAASNVSARLAKPRHLIIGIYLPLNTKERDLRTIVRELGGEASKYGVTVAAGQTGTYNGLKIPLITVTCIGDEIRRPKMPIDGDLVYVIGTLGAESVWLKKISKGIISDEWRNFTPLSVSLRLRDVEGVRFMHDVSEGGLKKALLEIVESLSIKVELNSSKLNYADGVKDLGVDVLQAPTYGSLIVISKPDSSREIEKLCEEMDIQHVVAGVIGAGTGLYVDGEKIVKIGRISIDELYGTFKE